MSSIDSIHRFALKEVDAILDFNIRDVRCLSLTIVIVVAIIGFIVDKIYFSPIPLKTGYFSGTSDHRLFDFSLFLL